MGKTISTNPWEHFTGIEPVSEDVFERQNKAAEEQLKKKMAAAKENTSKQKK